MDIIFESQLVEIYVEKFIKTNRFKEDINEADDDVIILDFSKEKTRIIGKCLKLSEDKNNFLDDENAEDFQFKITYEDGRIFVEDDKSKYGIWKRTK
jgi:hypothetical protein